MDSANNSPMQNTVNKELLRFHVSSTMFCPSCRTCLDVSTSVSVDVMKNGQLAKTYCMCSRCWTERKPSVEAAIAGKPEYSLTVLDGAVLFPRPARRRRR